MEKIRFGLIGAGVIAPSHITAIKNTGGAELTAICEVREEIKEKLEKEYGVPCFTDIDRMLESGLVDAVTVTTPSGLHLEPALKAIEAGKHVLVEKPMEITAERIDRMTEEAKRKNVKLACVFQSRFRPLPRKIRELIKGGILGEIYSASAYCKAYRSQEYYDSGGWRGTWELDGGGCLMNQGIHTVDLLLWNMDPVDEITAFTECKGRKNIEVETLASAILKYSSGATGVIEATTLAYPGMGPHIEIFGSKGTVKFSSGKLFLFELLNPSPEEERAKNSLIEEQSQKEEQAKRQQMEKGAGKPVASFDLGHTPIIEDIVNAIRTDSEPFITGEQARISVEVITSIYESSKNGSKPVRLKK